MKSTKFDLKGNQNLLVKAVKPQSDIKNAIVLPKYISPFISY